MNLLQFFQDGKGQLSSLRLIVFLFSLNAICLSWLSNTNVELISAFLIPATSGKVGQKVVEMYFDKKDERT